MKVLWVSPTGYGQTVATEVKDAGHTILSYGSALPGIAPVDKGALTAFAKAADLVVVDGPFPLLPTRRSWRPAPEALFFDELRRHHAVVALGPTPTVDLLVGDPRYLRKMCGRYGIPYSPDYAAGEVWSSGGWFLGHEIVPDGPYLRPLAPLFKSVGFRGWFELLGTMTEDGPVVRGAEARWDPETIPEARAAEWLQTMMRR